MTLLGTFVGVPGSNTSGAYASFTNALGQNATELLSYVNDAAPESGWVNDAQYTANQFASTSWSQNVTPTVDIPMASVGENADSSFKNIINGSEDSIFNGIFQAWANAGYRNFYVDPGWEMNSYWLPWSVTTGNAGDYVAAFQHIAALAHNFGGANIQVVWTPNVGSHGAVPVPNLYPGNGSVDVIGLDTYGEPVNVDNSPYDTSTDPNDWTLTDALNLAKANGKPFALPETGGTDAAFPAALAKVIAQSGVQPVFMNIWDTSDATNDLTWSNDPSVAAAWRQAFATISGSGSQATTSDTTSGGTSGTTAGTTTTTTPASTGSNGTTGANTSAVTYTDAVLTTSPVSGGTATVGLISSGSLDQAGISQTVDNGVDTITADNPVWSEWAQIVGDNVNLSFIKAGNLTVAGNTGSATISAASGNNTFLVGSGSMDITGGPGTNNYEFSSGSGSLKIEDYKLGVDTLTVSKSLQGGYQTTSDGSGGTLLSFGTGSSIDLINQSAPTRSQIHWV